MFAIFSVERTLSLLPYALILEKHFKKIEFKAIKMDSYQHFSCKHLQDYGYAILSAASFGQCTNMGTAVTRCWLCYVPG